MRIDLNGLTADQITTTQQPSTPVGRTGTAQSAEPAEDQTSLSLDTIGISALAAKAMQMPEIRQDKVEALRQAVRQGQYQVDANKVADAMLGEKVPSQ